MSKKTFKDSHRSGFTIVELLIVIVIIGILAAITLVAYSGMTARANTANAQNAAENTSKKAETYNVEGTGGYPTTLATLTGAASTTSYYLAGVTDVATAMTVAPATAAPLSINFYRCGTGATTTAPTTLVGITTQTGNKIGYWDYSAGAVAFDTAGQASGLVGTYNIGCAITAS